MKLQLPHPPGCQVLHVSEWPHELYLDMLVVHPDAQNKGVGSLVIRRLQALARKKGKCIRLQALAEAGCKRKLMRFYKRHGFRAVRKSSLPDKLEWIP